MSKAFPMAMKEGKPPGLDILENHMIAHIASKRAIKRFAHSRKPFLVIDLHTVTQDKLPFVVKHKHRVSIYFHETAQISSFHANALKILDKI